VFADELPVVALEWNEIERVRAALMTYYETKRSVAQVTDAVVDHDRTQFSISHIYCCRNVCKGQVARCIFLRSLLDDLKNIPAVWMSFNVRIPNNRIRVSRAVQFVVEFELAVRNYTI
jgi:hypothetical protein